MSVKQHKKTNHKLAVLNVYQVGKSFGAFTVFKNINFSANTGEKLALVGINGAGKSTLMKIIAGVDTPDSGAITFREGLKVAYLAQDLQFDSSHTLYDEMLT